MPLLYFVKSSAFFVVIKLIYTFIEKLSPPQLMLARIRIIIFFILVPLYVAAQSQLPDGDKPAPAFKLNGGVDMVSRYVWRGQNYGDAPSFQPYGEIEWRGYKLGVWGAYKLYGKGDNETDLYVSKSFGPLELAIWDYWFLEESSPVPYFNYRSSETAHLFEFIAKINGGDFLPLNFTAGYMFYGADPDKSLYLELEYFKTFFNTDFSVVAGYQARGSYYAQSPSFVNLGISATKGFSIRELLDFELTLSFYVNPNEKRSYFVVMMSL